MWYANLKLRSLKDIKSKGILFGKLFRNFKAINKTTLLVNDMATRAQITPSRLSDFMTGLWEDMPIEILGRLLQQIQIPPTAFRDFAKNTAIPGIGVFDKNIMMGGNALAAMAPAAPAAPASVAPANVDKPATPRNNASSATASPSKGFKIKNYEEQPFIVTFANGILEIHPNDPTTLAQLKKDKKKAILIPNAVLFGNSYVPGEAVID